MILVFGGTTEGRKAVEVLEEAGSLYYYSTRSDGQELSLLHGRRLTGAMDVVQMVASCREHGVRLLVDAAHPFAEELHRNLLFVARHVGAPLIRYDRIYPPRTDEAVWCKDYQEAMTKLEREGIDRLLALTGVNNIGTLRPYWEKHECWFRILRRPLSLMMVRKAGFPEDHLVYYEEDHEAVGGHEAYIDEGTRQLLEQLKPQAILTKESGQSGGFTQKVRAAKATGVKVFVIERPEYPPQTPNPQNVHIEYVNGPHGLRRAVEHLLPAFFPLHSGLTTGTCATAAAVAATLQYGRRSLQAVQPTVGTCFMYVRNIVGEGSKLCSPTVPVILPDGETIAVPVGYGDGYAYCVKEGGDDPDVTNGLEIRAKAAPAETFEIAGGEGVGRFTLPGFDFPPGEAAINKGPREMIRQNVMAIACSPLKITISIPKGRETALRTFNPRLGIEGGISVIGVTGIVKPFSEEAFIGSIRKCMEVAKASGTGCVVMNSGGKSERFVKALCPHLPRQAFVEYGNYVGETLRMAHELGFASVTLGVMLGKAVKLAEGHLDTHSRKTTMNSVFVGQMLREAGISIDISDITLARELWQRIPATLLQAFASTVIGHCHRHCDALLPHAKLTILLIDDDGNIYH